MSKKEDSSKRQLLTGLALGAGITAGAAYLLRRYPYSVPAQLRRKYALNKALRKAQSDGVISPWGSHSYIIFSDHHKGTRNRADRFRFCEATYRAALDYYFEQGFTLIILGDAEELWEEQIEPVIAANTHILEREARFYVLDRYLRLSGNHDNAWESETLVRRHLDAYFPGIHVRRELLFELPLRERGMGKVLLAHGHQGTLDADFFPFIPQAILPYYRDVQYLTNFGQSSPSQDDCLRSLQDTHMYRWANTQEGLILIAGHTHRPVWSSLTHLDQLILQLHSLQRTPVAERSPDYSNKLIEHINLVEQRATKYPPCDDTLKTRPCYFNTGCCSYSDGDITGLEIVNGEISLVKWGPPEAPSRKPLESSPLVEIVFQLARKKAL